MTTQKEDKKTATPVVPVKAAPPIPPKAPNIFKPNFSNFNKSVRTATFMSNNRGRR
jgi:hypothetical protein